MDSPDAVALPAIIILEEETASCICFPPANWQSWNKCSGIEISFGENYIITFFLGGKKPVLSFFASFYPVLVLRFFSG